MEDIFGRLRSGAGKAAFEADKMRRVVAVQNTIRSLEGELAQIKGEIGQVAYSLHLQGTDFPPELESVCEQADKLQARIDAQQQQIQAIRAEAFDEEAEVAQYGRVCPNGHGRIAAEDNFCQQCGARAIEVAPPEPVAPSGASCQNCGASLTAGAQFCINCGQAVEAPTATATCPACGATRLPDAVFCSDCGHRYEEGSATTAEPQQEIMDVPSADAEEVEAPLEVEEASAELLSDPFPPPEPVAEEPEQEPLPADQPETPTIVNSWNRPQEDREDQTHKEEEAPPAGTEVEESFSPTSDQIATPAPPEREHDSFAEGGEPDENASNLTQKAEVADTLCPLCGAELMEDAAFCVVCGHHLPAEEANPPSPTAAADEACPQCGAELLPDAVFCVECGYRARENPL